MTSPASLAALGGSRATPYAGLFECSPSLVAVRRIRVVSRVSCRSFSWARRWSNPVGFVCRCTITTDSVEEKLNVFTPESMFRNGSSGAGSSSSDDVNIILKPSPKPVLKMRPNIDDEPANALQLSAPKLAVAGVERSDVVEEDKLNVIESLGEVLEKAEKLENANSVKFDTEIRSSRPSVVTRSEYRAVNSSSPENPPSVAKKSKTLKSVWRKGNPVADVQKVVKELPKVFNRKSINPSTNVEDSNSDSPPRAPFRPQAPQKFEPKLQSRPSVAASHPTAPTEEKKKPAERKPILIDKFASKKRSLDPVIAQAVLAPRKPVKPLPPSKYRDTRRKKEGATGSNKKRLVNDKGKMLDEDASELNIPGATNVRKGRKWNKARRRAERLKAAKASAPVKAEIIEVGEEGMLTEDLAYSLAVSEADILSYLFAKGVKPDTVHTLDRDMVKIICKEFEVEVIEVEATKVEEMAKKKEIFDEGDLEMLEDRPPVLTIMGHVDHGKTTLLDYIRKSKVVASEAGGITQGIGAYKVQVPVDGKLQPCVFLDTPGHEAFGAMRARGARVTDIAIIVVAADDGVRPQTNEAIAHAKAAGVPIVVAINKIDKDGASPERVMQELSSVGLMPEEWGGDVPMVQISALKGENVDDLLETVMLVAELQELKANPQRNAKGTVIEAGLDKAKGPIATFIVQNGTLKKGDVIVCGEAFGKVRALFDDRGVRVDEARPSTAVQIIGLNNVPIAGDEFEVVNSLDIAREKADSSAEKLRTARMSEIAGDGKVTLSSIASAVSAGKQTGLDMHQLNIILKVDVQGSIEAVRHAIQVLPQENVTLKFLLQASGDVSMSDVDLAVATEGIILGFNVKTPGSIKSYAEKKNVEIRLYRVIYELIDELRNAMEGLLEPVEDYISIGTAEVRAVFSSGSGRAAGCMVTEGKVVKECGIRVVRNGKTIHTGRLDSLRRVKEEVKEVNAGLECGVGIDDYTNWEAGDVIEAFNTVKKQRTLEEASASVAAALAGAGLQKQR